MKSIRLLLQVLGLSVITVGCINGGVGGESQGSQIWDGGVHFLQQKSTNGLQMEALMEGRLVLEEGCLRIQSSYGGESSAAIWPFEFSFSVQNGSVNILDGEGQVVAQVGDHIRVSGGARESAMSQEEFEKSYLGPYRCSDPYWIAGYEVRVITP